MVEIAQQQRSAGTVDLVAGRLCLDYVNTVAWRQGADADEQEEVLRTYTDLVAWAHHAGALTTDEAVRLRVEGAHRPNEAAEALARARALRETLYRIFAAVVTDQDAAASDMALFNTALARTLAQARIAPDAGGYAWSWGDETDDLGPMLRPVVRSAADLLTNAAELGHIRACAHPRCDWLFLDTSRNHSRRWCSMEQCGNRAKARRHYQRARAGSAR